MFRIWTLVLRTLGKVTVTIFRRQPIAMQAQNGDSHLFRGIAKATRNERVTVTFFSGIAKVARNETVTVTFFRRQPAAMHAQNGDSHLFSRFPPKW